LSVCFVCLMLPIHTLVAGVRFSTAFVCVSACLFVRTISPKTDAAKITKLDTEMFHGESWRPIYFGVRRSKVKVTMHKETVPAWVSVLLWLLASAGFFSALTRLARWQKGTRHVTSRRRTSATRCVTANSVANKGGRSVWQTCGNRTKLTTFTTVDMSWWKKTQKNWPNLEFRTGFQRKVTLFLKTP